MTELHITQITQAQPHSANIEHVFLAWDDRCKPRQRAITDKGTEVAIALERGTILMDSDVLYSDEHRTIMVRAKDEPVLIIYPKHPEELCRVSHHLGNWHRSLEFKNGEILTQPDQPMVDWLTRNGIDHEQRLSSYNPNLRTQPHE